MGASGTKVRDAVESGPSEVLKIHHCMLKIQHNTMFVKPQRGNTIQRIFFALIGSSPSPKWNSSPVTAAPSRTNRTRVGVVTLKKKSPFGDANNSNRSSFVGMLMKRCVPSRVTA